MEKIIIYENENGGITIIAPLDCGLTIEEIALKDVPSGTPYKIINRSDLPEDRTFRNAWEADFSSPDGYGIGNEVFWQMKGDNLI